MMRMVLLAVLLPFGAQAAELAVSGAFARASLGSGPGVVYFTITGGDVADRLVSASSVRAGHVALHSMMMQGEVMRMREVDAIEVAAGATVSLKPGGLHMMLEGLKAPLKQGETVPLVLHFEKAGERVMEVPVGAVGASGPAMGPAMGPHVH